MEKCSGNSKNIRLEGIVVTSLNSNRLYSMCMRVRVQRESVYCVFVHLCGVLSAFLFGFFFVKFPKPANKVFNQSINRLYSFPSVSFHN